MTFVQPPSLEELTQWSLSQPASGTASSEVEPYHQALPHPWINPQILWPEALLAAQLLAPEDATAWSHHQMPVGWAKRFQQLPSQKLVACGVGQAPAFLRDITPLLRDGIQTLSSPVAVEPPVATEESKATADKAPDRLLLSAAQARLDSRFNDAATLLSDLIETAPDHWHALLENETALLHWARGDMEAAEAMWSHSAFATHVVYQFNRAVAALARRDATTAIPLLRSARKALPPSSGWHALSYLYLTVIEAE